MSAATTTIDQAQADLDRTRSAYIFAERQVRRAQKRAGRAETSREAINDELTKAVEIFASSDWSELEVLEIASAGGRIERLARMLSAADRIPELLEAMLSARADWKAAQARLEEARS